MSTPTLAEVRAALATYGLPLPAVIQAAEDRAAALEALHKSVGRWDNGRPDFTDLAHSLIEAPDLDAALADVEAEAARRLAIEAITKNGKAVTMARNAVASTVAVSLPEVRHMLAEPVNKDLDVIARHARALVAVRPSSQALSVKPSDVDPLNLMTARLDNGRIDRERVEALNAVVEPLDRLARVIPVLSGGDGDATRYASREAFVIASLVRLPDPASITSTTHMRSLVAPSDLSTGPGRAIRETVESWLRVTENVVPALRLSRSLIFAAQTEGLGLGYADGEDAIEVRHESIRKARRIATVPNTNSFGLSPL